jgi:hypothetical protein
MADTPISQPEDQPDDLVLLRLREIRTLLGEVKEDTSDIRLRVRRLSLAEASEV